MNMTNLKGDKACYIRQTSSSNSMLWFGLARERLTALRLRMMPADSLLTMRRWRRSTSRGAVQRPVYPGLHSSYTSLSVVQAQRVEYHHTAVQNVPMTWTGLPTHTTITLHAHGAHFYHVC